MVDVLPGTRADNYDAFCNRVVDPIWLEQSSDPSAVALRQARQDANVRRRGG